ncbi:Uma2 family endonuclease [Chroococcus sp. FPU101]|uniref:Uma2 family endonuclease n=1 Tax=Chroococcus sp. FPU101 TaxID=1974212 RepID=UPI001A8F87FC|nr:Uma2 family endonuclease [Chroococcus sp. FPU101]
MQTSLLSSVNADRILLNDVSWETYEKLREIFADYSSIRLNYYKGLLELMTPLLGHEIYSWTLGRLVTILSEELDLEIKGLKSTTWRSQTQEVGKEADECFYIQNEPLVRNKLKIDLQADPPPDLVIEVDLTHSAINKFLIYAGLKVPEIWCYQDGKLQIYLLTATGYQESQTSLAFKSFPVKQIVQFMQLDLNKGENARMKEFRKWVREILSNQSFD